MAALGGYSGGVMQLERGEERTEKNPEGFLHWQIYVENSTPVRFSTLRGLLPSAHIERRRGSRREAFEYCTKEGTRVGEPVHWGEIELEDQQGRRSDLEEMHAEILGGVSLGEVLKRYPGALRNVAGLRALAELVEKEKRSTAMRDVVVTYLQGPAGAGKTSYVMGQHPVEKIFRVTDYKHPFDSYSGQEVLVLDEFQGQLDFHFFLNLIDRYPLELPARYRNRWAAFSEVWVVSNADFEDQYVFHRVDELDVAFRRRFTAVMEMGSGGEIEKVRTANQGGIVGKKEPRGSIPLISLELEGLD